MVFSYPILFSRITSPSDDLKLFAGLVIQFAIFRIDFNANCTPSKTLSGVNCRSGPGKRVQNKIVLLCK